MEIQTKYNMIIGYQVEERGYDTPCWTHNKKPNPDGYVYIMRNSIKYMAHRYYYIESNGEIPENLQLDHLCRNRNCVNPSHLEPVSQKENIRRGDSAKLNNNSVAWIKNIKNPNRKNLASMFGIDKSTLSYLLSEKTWGDVKPYPNIASVSEWIKIAGGDCA